MSDQSPTRSKWLQSHDPIPEMELQDFVKLIKTHFDLHTLLEDKPYKVRFIDSPGNPFHPDCRSIVVTSHHRGTVIDPISIKQTLAKFEITEERFKEAYNSYFTESADKRIEPTH